MGDLGNQRRKDSSPNDASPANWVYCPFGDVCEASQYGINSTSDEGNSYPMLKMNNLQNGKIDTRDLVYVNLTDREFDDFGLKTNDLLVNRTNSYELVGKTALFDLPGQYTFASYLVRFRLDERRVEPRFVCYYFDSDQGRGSLKTLATKGVSQANINPTTLKREFIIPVPPLPEQRKIAAILGTWDEAIALTERRIAAGQQRKQGLMQRLLTGQVQFPEFAQHPWIETRIGDVLQNVTRLVPLEDDQLYRQAIVRRWSAGIEYREPLYGHQIKGKALQQVHEGDFLISNIQAAYGAMSKVGKDSEGAWISNIYTILVPKHDRSMDIDYFNYLSQTPIMQHLVIASCNGFKAERIRLGFVVPTFLKQQISIPAQYEEQRRVAEVLTACDRELDLLARKRDALQRQKRGLMQQLLTGRVRVKV
jgi:type I restriction enzyme, S subunit